MKATYEEIIDDIIAVAESHKQVNDTGHGDPWEVNKKEYDYPLFFLTDGVSRAEGGRFVLGLKFMTMDKTLNSEINEKRVLSNTLLIVNDIIGKVWADSRLKGTYTLNLDSIEYHVFTNSFGDDVAGWVADVDIHIDNAYDTCNAPFE